MQWLCNHEDQNMQRMAVAIISILAAKVCHLFIFSFTFFFNHVKLLPTSFFIFLPPVVHRADRTVGSRTVYSEGMIPISLVAPPACLP